MKRVRQLSIPGQMGRTFKEIIPKAKLKKLTQFIVKQKVMNLNMVNFSSNKKERKKYYIEEDSDKFPNILNFEKSRLFSSLFLYIFSFSQLGSFRK
jgi:hypothetical protein